MNKIDTLQPNSSVRKSKQLTVRATDTTFYTYDPVVGFWGIPNMERDVYFAGMSDKYIHVRHNSEGNRDKQYEPANMKGCVLSIGGSHTWGGGVEQTERYSEHLERLLGMPVINIGHCSLGLDQICLAILERSKLYNPSVIVVEQYPWAIHRVLNTYVNGYTRPYFYLDAAGDLKLQKMSSLTRFKIFRSLIGSYYSYRKELQEFTAGINLKEGYDPWTDPIFLHWKLPYYDKMYNLVESIISVMQDHCMRNGIKLLFGLGAIMQQVGKSSPSALIDYDLPRNRLISILKKRKVAYRDMTSIMKVEHTVSDPVMFPDGHMNGKGHRLFAEEISQELQTRKWVKV